MKFREKLLDFKRRLSDRHMYSIVIVVIGLVAIWGFYQYRQEMQFRQRTENGYNRAFYEMAGNVRNVEVMLTKAMIANTPEQGIENLSEVWRQANIAQANLGQLPISQTDLGNVSKFLNQVSDYSYSLIRQNLDQKPITQEQFDTIQRLHDYAVKMNASLNKLEEQMGQGRIRWGELSRKGKPAFQKASQSITAKDFESLGKDFEKMPSLIYDGPFSDALRDIKPKGLGDKKVTEEEAKEAASKFIGKDKINEIKSTGKSDGNFKAYNFQVTMKNGEKNNSMAISVTQQGGHVLMLTGARKVTKDILNMNQAKDKAKEFLKSRGFDNMVDTYYLKEDGSATINYAYMQNSVIIYPDLIKVKIALDNGEIIGFEAKNYYLSHTERVIKTPKVTQEEAQKVINPKLKINSAGMAIIPTAWKTEVLTYEFKGKVDNRDFIVYVNAETGKEERILLIINTPNGTLTM